MLGFFLSGGYQTLLILNRIDMYLGPSYRYYSTIEPPLPQYCVTKWQRNMWWSMRWEDGCRVDFLSDDRQYKICLSSVISQAVDYLCLDKPFPDALDINWKWDTLLHNYPGAGKMNPKYGSFFVDQQLLFTTDPICWWRRKWRTYHK